MFTQSNILIDRPVETVFDFVSNLPKQLECWELVSRIKSADNDSASMDIKGYINIGGKSTFCTIELYITRPGSGCVTKILWDSGELAAEWRFIQEAGRTRIELTIEGSGGGLARSGPLRQLSPHILMRLKQKIDVA